MSVTPDFSIIVPCFNRETLIKETLDSVLNQSHKNWECIVVDDGSTDSSISIVKQYSESDERVKFFQRENRPKGAPSCRNMGIECATGTFLIFLDSDDLLAPWCLTERLDFLKNNPNFDASINYSVFFDETVGNFGAICPGISGHSNKTSAQLFYSMLSLSPYSWATQCSTWRASAISQAQLTWDEELPIYQDPNFHIRAFSKGFKFAFFSELPDSYIRAHAGDRVSTVSSLDRLKSKLDSLNKTKQVLEKKELLFFERKILIETVTGFEYLVINNLATYSDFKNLPLASSWSTLQIYFRWYIKMLSLKKKLVTSIVYRVNLLILSIMGKRKKEAFSDAKMHAHQSKLNTHDQTL